MANNLINRLLIAEPVPLDCFYLLNPDTIVQPDALSSLIELLENTQNLGVVGSQLEDKQETNSVLLIMT